MATSFASPLDIQNRALQYVGSDPITSTTELRKSAIAVNFAYDKCRRAELRRNIWRFATRRAIVRPIDDTTVYIKPGLYSATIPYSAGAIVSDSAGQLWISQVPNNLGNTPGQGTDVSIWDTYFGPLTAFPWVTGGGYFAGDLVYETKGVNAVLVYSALVTGTTNDPSVTQAWSATTTYNRNNVVLYGGYYWMSLIDRNLNQTPGAYSVWQASLTYAKEAKAYSTIDGHVYTSLIDSNKGNEPNATSNVDWNDTGILAPWASSFYEPTGDLQWLRQTAGIQPTDIIYPIGTGPVSQSITRNVYRLPNGFLRQAPQGPTEGRNTVLGAPSGMSMTDWVYEGNFIVSREADAIPLRFVADITNVSQMDDMFCEGLACRIALGVCEQLTQSASKLQGIASEYKRFMGEARLVNGIEEGPTDPPLDDWLRVRV